MREDLSAAFEGIDFSKKFDAKKHLPLLVEDINIRFRQAAQLSLLSHQKIFTCLAGVFASEEDNESRPTSCVDNSTLFTKLAHCKN
jgi:hypothetical protein